MSQCVPQRRTRVASSQKKEGGTGRLMFDPNASVQSIIRVRHGAVWGTTQEKGMVFESRWRPFGKNKNWVGPSGDQKKFELSSCSETTCQSRASTLRARIGAKKLRRLPEWQQCEKDTVTCKPCTALRTKARVLGSSKPLFSPNYKPFPNLVNLTEIPLPKP